jgi:hypothetical protein
MMNDMQNRLASSIGTMFLGLFILILATMYSEALRAQVAVGARVGYNLNTVYTTNGLGAVAPNFLSLDEASVGVVLEIPVAGSFSVQPELAYTTRGFGLKQGLDTEVLGVALPLEARAETRIRYLEMPVLAKYKFGQDALQAYLAAGPTLSYASAGQVDAYATALIELDLGTTNVDLEAVNYERWDVGATLGVGLQYDFGPVSTFVDARYYRGFSELYDIPLVNERVRNRGYGFNIGFMVPVGS